jgi:hypothetical protein
MGGLSFLLYSITFAPAHVFLFMNDVSAVYEPTRL